jgi:transglutaminase-like putative cysteine protease
VWLPFPQQYGRQTNVKLLSSDPPDAVIAPSAHDGNPVRHGQRTVFLQRKIEDPTKPQVFQIVFAFTTSAYYPDLDATKPTASAAHARADLSTFLAERPPHIVFTAELRAKVEELTKGDPDPLSRARKIFYFVDENVRWTPEEEYCLIPNLAMHGLARGKGDCGVASMLFITMCRIAGVPARWQSGWTTNPVGWNMHDWAEIYVEPWGWLPVDASYGRQKSDDPAIRDFYFGHADSHRLIINLDYGHELTPPKKTLRSEPLDFQRGEVELDGKNLYFDEWGYDIQFERSPGP